MIVKYITSLILVVTILSTLYATSGLPTLPDGEESVLATFTVTLHVDRVDNSPIYRETHQMNGLEQGFRIDEGLAKSGNLSDIDWRHDLVFLRIARQEGVLEHEVSLSVIKYTAEGVKYEKLPSVVSEDFTFAVTLN